MQQFYAWRHYILGISLLIGAMLFPGMQTALKIDNSLQSWFIEGDPALDNYYLLQDNFGNDELLILVLESDSSSILEADKRARVEALIQSLEADTAVAYVLHPFLWESPDPVSGFLPQKLVPADTKRATEIIGQNGFLKSNFFSKDFKATRLYLKFENLKNFEAERANIIRGIYDVCELHWPKQQITYGGLGVIYEALNQLSAQDFGLFLGLGYIIMFMLIALLYRHWKFTLYAMGTVALASYFTLAIYGSFGLRLNLLSTLIPTIIILLGVMDVMHILNEFRRTTDFNEDSKIAALLALKRIWLPCLFTSISTMAGFLSLVISPVAILAQFGLFAALGIGLALFFSFLLGVYILPNAPAIQSSERSTYKLAQLQAWVVKHPKPIALFLFLILAIGAWAIPQIKVDTDSIGYLPEDHRVRLDSDKIEELFGAYMPLDYLIISSDSSLAMPGQQQLLLDLDQQLSQLPAIGSMNGYHDLLAALVQARNPNSENDDWAQDPFLDLEVTSINEFNPELKNAFLNDDGSLGRFYLSGELVSAATLERTLNQVDSIAKASLGTELQIVAAGYQSLYANIVNYITESQVKSFLLAGLMIFLLLWLFLKDLKLSLISLVPNFFPVVVLLSTMGIFNIALDTATASIASIVLSFSIDDTMHFIWHYRTMRKEGAAAAEARKKTMTHVGRAIVLTSLILFAGYALMWFGSLKTVVYFGTLTACSIAAALISQLFFFPLLLAKWDR